jgi:hypothetical protein
LRVYAESRGGKLLTEFLIAEKNQRKTRNFKVLDGEE